MTPDAATLAPAVQFDLASFDLSSMIECGRAVRQVGVSAASMEAAGLALVRFFYSNLVDAESGERNCALVRCFKTHRFAQLPPGLAASARELMSDKSYVKPQMQCLTLLATVGDLPEWNDRKSSQRHAAIPLESADMVRRAPMIASLLRQMGIAIETALYPTPKLMLDVDQHAFNVFHVEDAVGDPSVPAQEGFVRTYGIRSVLGFGGLLPTGDLFAVIMFSRTPIPRATADMFRTIALGVKLALLPHTRGPVFANTSLHSGLSLVAAGATRGELMPGETAEEELRAEAATLRMLIPELEEAALHQTARLKSAFAVLQKREEQVRQQGARLGAMLEATTDGVMLLDREWRFTFLNNHAQDAMASGRELLGTNLWDLYSDAVGHALWTNFHKVMHEGASVHFQEHGRAQPGKVFEVHAFPIQDGIAAFFHDITDRLKAEAALRQTDKLAVTGRMAASIAHEINNPLEAVTNLLYLLTHDASLGESAKQFAKQASQELQRVSEITTHMLRFYRQSTRPTWVAVEEVLESVLVLFQGRLGQAGVLVEKRYGSSGKLEAFAGELRQIFANLVANAIDASRHGGRLVLRVRDARAPVTGQPGTRVTIADTGRGMSRAVMARLFEPFFTTKGITGTGLGLWVSLELLQKHGASVRVRSSEAEGHQGAVFALFFPSAAGLEQTPGAQDSSLTRMSE